VRAENQTAPKPVEERITLSSRFGELKPRKANDQDEENQRSKEKQELEEEEK